jgi:putative ABC transport system permease protein
MIRNYFKIALRNILKHKGFSFINVAGVAVGLACFLLIALYVRDELSYDRYNTNAERIYRVTRTFLSSEGTVSLKLAQLAPPFGPLIKQDFPEAEQVVRTLGTDGLLRYGEHAFNEQEIFFAEPNLFKVFNLNVSGGNPDQALVNPFSIMFSRPMAEKYFGQENPVGKTVRLDQQFELTVTGCLNRYQPRRIFIPISAVVFNAERPARVRS